MPTRKADELWLLYREEEVEEVHSKSDPSWRHGEYRTTVIKDQEGRFWQGTYCVSGDGEQHEWRDGYASDFIEVEPFEEIVTSYRPKG